MKKTLNKCSGILPDGSFTAKCSTLFFGDTCPVCGSTEPIVFDRVDIPELSKVKKLLDRTMEEIHTRCWPTDDLEIRAGVGAALNILEGI